MPRSKLLVGVPVYRGSEFVTETLQCLQKQSYADYRVLVSVDGNDLQSAELCRRLTDDPRFEVVIQTSRLGWKGNFEWLTQQCEAPYFCYWQQDDLAESNYLQVLLERIESNSRVAVAFSGEVQWFGEREDRECGATTIAGDAAQRVLRYIEQLRYEPFRGLCRTSWLPESTSLSSGIAFYDLWFLTKMAAAGELLAVEGTVYRKRLHAKSWHASVPQQHDFRRGIWIDFAYDLWTAAMDLAPLRSCARELLATVLERMSIYQEGRCYAYTVVQNEREIGRFVHDFVARHPDVRDLIRQHEATRAPSEQGRRFGDLLEFRTDPRVARTLADALESDADLRKPRDCGRAESGESRRQLKLGVAAGMPGLELLGHGWSHPEGWGVWSDGEEASLWIPPLAKKLSITLRGSHIALSGEQADRRRILWRIDGQSDWRCESIRGNQATELRIPVDFSKYGQDEGSGLQLRLQFPDSVRPADHREWRDRRRLGFGLTHIEISSLTSWQAALRAWLPTSGWKPAARR